MYKSLNRELTHFVQDAAASYAKEKVDINDMLNDRFLIAELIEAGVPYSLFRELKDLFPFSLKEWSAYLDISLKSLQRYQLESRRFKPIHSEKIIELIEVFMFGIHVFEKDDQQFKLWLITPAMALGGKRPFDLLKNSYGQSLVMDALASLEYGIFA